MVFHKLNAKTLLSRVWPPLTISCGLTGLAPIPAHRALGPGQRELEGLEEVEDAPTDDDVVVEAHEAADLQETGGG